MGSHCSDFTSTNFADFSAVPRPIQLRVSQFAYLYSKCGARYVIKSWAPLQSSIACIKKRCAYTLYFECTVHGTVTEKYVLVNRKLLTYVYNVQYAVGTCVVLQRITFRNIISDQKNDAQSLMIVQFTSFFKCLSPAPLRYRPDKARSRRRNWKLKEGCDSDPPPKQYNVTERNYNFFIFRDSALQLWPRENIES